MTEDDDDCTSLDGEARGWFELEEIFPLYSWKRYRFIFKSRWFCFLLGILFGICWIVPATALLLIFYLGQQ